MSRRGSMYSGSETDPKWGRVRILRAPLIGIRELPDGRAVWTGFRLGHTWDRGCLVSLHRYWHAEDGDWGPWVESSRTERIKPPKKRVVPEMTAAELDAWAEYIAPYHDRGDSDWEISRLLPGWDDIYTFRPRRLPRDNYMDDSPPLWQGDSEFSRRASVRALALTRMVLRHIARKEAA